MTIPTIITSPDDQTYADLAPEPGEVTVVLAAVRCPAGLLTEIAALVERVEAMGGVGALRSLLADVGALDKRLCEVEGVADDFLTPFMDALGWGALGELSDSLL